MKGSVGEWCIDGNDEEVDVHSECDNQGLPHEIQVASRRATAVPSNKMGREA